MLMLTVISLLAGLYVWWRAVWPLRCKWWVKLLLSGLIPVAAFFFKIMRAVGGPLPFAPDSPAWFQLSFAWFYLVFMAYFLVLVAADILRFGILSLLPAWRRLPKETKLRVGNRTRLALLVAVATLVSVGMSQALCQPDVHELRIHLPIKQETRIALLADLHADAIKGRDFMRAVVEQVNALHPDMVLIVGDMADGTVAQRGSSLEPLRELECKRIYAVPGNHEYYSGYEQWAPYLATLGLELLNNEHRYIQDAELVVAGVTDPAARVFGLEQPDVTKALTGAPAGKPVLLLAHQPQLALQAEPAGVALQLSGHTHGGLMPGLAEITARYNCGYVCGLYRTAGGMQLYVSPGTSLWSGIPLRLGVPAEITLITLTPNAEPATKSPQPTLP